MSLLTELASGREVPEEVNVVVEILKGARQRFDFSGDHPRLEGIFASLAYPTDCGYIPRTSWESNKPLEVLVLVDEPTFPGCIIASRPIGVLKILGTDEKRSDKILAVPVVDPKYSGVRSVKDLSPHIQEDITHFFTTFRQSLGPKPSFEILGWGDETDARKIILHAIKVFRHKAAKERGLAEETSDVDLESEEESL